MIIIQNIDDEEFFKCWLVRYLHSADHHPARITKADQSFARKLYYKGIKFPVKTTDIQKIEKKNSIGISVFSYKNKEKYSIYVSKTSYENKHVNFLLIGEKGKRHYVLIKGNAFKYDHTLHRGRKHFCRYCLQAFRTVQKLKCHIKDYFKVNGKQDINMPKKDEYVKKL